MAKVKTYNYQFRKSFELKFHGEIEAKSEKDAEKKLREFAKNCHPGDDIDCGNTNYDSTRLDDGDDFSVWGD